MLLIQARFASQLNQSSVPPAGAAERGLHRLVNGFQLVRRHVTGEPEKDLKPTVRDGAGHDELRRLLTTVAVDTVVHQLEKRGITSSYLTGLRPLLPGHRLLGYARTLRFLPLREDQRPVLMSGVNAQRRAIEEARPDDVLVIDARGVPDAGTIGDILALRLQQRGAVRTEYTGTTLREHLREF